ncbi:MAG: SDR family oxidoreductase [Alphaproteobacteria bacterium]|nr:SDR family oxidoreductase [Alphaproteobacteria bacterium]
MPTENRLQGKVAIITGAASGIGAAAVDLFTEQGARVVACDVPGSALEQRHGDNPSAVTVAKDLTDEDAPQAVVDAAIAAFGRLDILFNNAGIAPYDPYLEQQPGTWERVIAVNVTAVNRLTLAAVPHLRQSGAGRVINTGSVASQMAAASLSAYVVSKHAVAGLTKQQALELGPLGITANYVQPGFIVTGMTERYVKTAPPGEIDYWRNKTTVGRLGEAIDVANAALFLAQDAASFINGTGIRVDGGATMKM